VTTPVRPPILPQAQAPQQGVGGVRNHAGQRAFFEAAMGRAPTAAPPAPQPQSQAMAAARAVTPQAAQARYTPKIPVNLPPEPPAQILRPGSLLDIKV
jgi:hypothetical protein